MASAINSDVAVQMRQDIFNRVDPYHDRFVELKNKVETGEIAIQQVQIERDDAIVRNQMLKSALEASEKEFLRIKHDKVSNKFLQVMSISNRMLPTQNSSYDSKLTSQDAKSLLLKEKLQEFQSHLDQDLVARKREMLEIASVVKDLTDDHSLNSLKQAFLNLKTGLEGLEVQLNLPSTKKPAVNIPIQEVPAAHVKKSVRSNLNLKQLGFDLELLDSLTQVDGKDKKPNVTQPYLMLEVNVDFGSAK